MHVPVVCPAVPSKALLLVPRLPQQSAGQRPPSPGMAWVEDAFDIVLPS